jgi:protein TonB
MAQAQIEVDGRTRAMTVVAVAALHVAAIVALIAGLGVREVVRTVDSLAAFDVPVPPPSPKATPEVVPEPARQRRAPAPRAPRPRPSPSPRIVISATPEPASGDHSRAGASNAGSDSGAGGQGAGTGGGGHGNGAGALARRAEKIAGELKIGDFPRSGASEREGRFIVVRYIVQPDGGVANCRVVQSSGSAQADAITCRLIMRRFRYRPALDASGNAVADQTGWKQWWWRPD